MFSLAFGNIKIILLAVLVAGTAYFVWDYQATKTENKRLTGEISRANDIINQLDMKNQAEAMISETSNEIIREIRNAPETDDAPVAPVLDRAIDRL